MILITFLVIAECIIFFLAKRSAQILSKRDVYPEISPSLIEKYKAFDCFLGWTNVAGSIKYENSKGRDIKYTYDAKGARSKEKSVEHLEELISTWGDSYCQCREVEDGLTWQNILSKRLNFGVSNYGVGNYGADQALLRLKKEYSSNPTPYVVLAITPYTITRITSVWKHFSEFGNVLAFKPRYVEHDNKLRFIPNIISEKEMLSDVNAYKEHVSKYDEHRCYIDKHVYRFPYLLSALIKPQPLYRTICQKLATVFLKLKKQKIAEYFASKYFEFDINYRKTLNKKYNRLQQLIFEDFSSFAKENNFKPILLYLPAIEDVRDFKKTSDRYYAHFNTTEELTVLDFMDVLSHNENINDCYVDSLWGGHYSHRGNQILAEYLEKQFNEIRTKV